MASRFAETDSRESFAWWQLYNPWSIKNPSITDISQAGFIYTGEYFLLLTEPAVYFSNTNRNLNLLVTIAIIILMLLV